MKKIFNLLVIATFIFTLTSCNNDDDTTPQLSGENTVHIEFDASFNDDDLILGNTYTNANGENLTINAFDYIVSNFVLVEEDGTEFTYPKDNSYFIISEGGEGKVKNVDVMLENIPAGKYTKIKFGLGVDQERYLQGQSVQEDFWQQAETYSMTWSWQAGYKFVVQEGTFTSANVTEAQPYRLHIASRGSQVDLYKEVELDMSPALVDSEKSPQLHVVVNASKMLDGTNAILLQDDNEIMGGDKAELIANNNKEMFMVHHVHNGNDHH